MSDLREPVESLQIPGGSISCLAVAPETESLLVGDEQGSLYTITASATATANKKKTSLRRKQVKKLEPFSSSDVGGSGDGSVGDKSATDAVGGTSEGTTNNGHFGMVTSIATRSKIQSASTGLLKGFCRGSGGLVLSTGVDWTTQLWAPAYKDTPLLSWTSHSYDSVSDVQWNPQNPGLFATASSNGTVGLWNLAHSMDEALMDGLKVSNTTTTTTDDDTTIEGLSKLCWSNPDGRRLAVAGGKGRVHVVTFANDVVRPQGDEDSKIVQQLISRGLLHRA
jgi:dynein intermediate chain